MHRTLLPTCVVHSLHLDGAQALEDVLDVFNIMLCRQLARQEVSAQIHVVC